MEKGIFDLEVREKRNQAFLNKARTGSKGGSRSRKGLRTPFDTMSAKDKKKLNGEVKTVMYETIIPYAELILKDEEMQKLMFTRWTEIYEVKEIKEQMKIGTKIYYELVKNFNVPRKKRGGNVRKTKAEREKKHIAIVENKAAVAPPEEYEKPKIKPLIISRGLHLEYNGEYTADQLNKIFMKLQLLTEAEENKFSLSISLTERT